MNKSNAFQKYIIAMLCLYASLLAWSLTAQQLPDLKPNERMLVTPINGYFKIQVTRIDLTPEVDGVMNPHVYYNLIGERGTSTGHAVTVADLFSLTLNPDLDSIEKIIVADIENRRTKPELYERPRTVKPAAKPKPVFVDRVEPIDKPSEKIEGGFTHVWDPLTLTYKFKTVTVDGEELLVDENGEPIPSL